MCTQCYSFSAHLFERLGVAVGPYVGMKLKHEFCEALLLACDNQIEFGGRAEYGMSYCEQHVGLEGDSSGPVHTPTANIAKPVTASPVK